MNEAELFQIGEVAKLFHVSVGTLRHYEQVGLLTPEYIAPDSGYRYYSTRQFEVLNTIRYLRALDMSLSQIGDFLKNKDTQVIQEKLLRQKEAVARKRRELERIERKIDNRLNQLQSATTANLDVIRLESMPACRIVWMRDSLKPQSYLDLEQSIRKLEAGQKTSVVFLGKVGLGITPENLVTGRLERYDLIFLILDPEDDYEGDTQLFPAGNCLSVRFRGSHMQAPSQYEKLLSYIQENNLQISGFSREITLIDNGITDDPSKFVTEIRIPIASL